MLLQWASGDRQVRAALSIVSHFDIPTAVLIMGIGKASVSFSEVSSTIDKLEARPFSRYRQALKTMLVRMAPFWVRKDFKIMDTENTMLRAQYQKNRISSQVIPMVQFLWFSSSNVSVASDAQPIYLIGGDGGQGITGRYRFKFIQSGEEARYRGKQAKVPPIFSLGAGLPQQDNRRYPHAPTNKNVPLFGNIYAFVIRRDEWIIVRFKFTRFVPTKILRVAV